MTFGRHVLNDDSAHANEIGHLIGIVHFGVLVSILQQSSQISTSVCVCASGSSNDRCVRSPRPFSPPWLAWPRRGCLRETRPCLYASTCHWPVWTTSTTKRETSASLAKVSDCIPGQSWRVRIDRPTRSPSISTPTPTIALRNYIKSSLYTHTWNNCLKCKSCAWTKTCSQRFSINTHIICTYCANNINHFIKLV